MSKRFSPHLDYEVDDLQKRLDLLLEGKDKPEDSIVYQLSLTSIVDLFIVCRYSRQPKLHLICNQPEKIQNLIGNLENGFLDLRSDKQSGVSIRWSKGQEVTFEFKNGEDNLFVFYPYNDSFEECISKWKTQQESIVV